MSGRSKAAVAVLVLLAATGSAGAWLRSGLVPTSPAEPLYVRFEKQTPLARALEIAKEEGAVRNPKAVHFYASLKRQTRAVPSGTYQIRPGMTADEILKALRTPVRQMVRIPEGWWIARVAQRLEEHGVCTAAEYESLAKSPAEFKDVVGFELPADSLEGYLYPDTYDLPPLIGARAAIVRQLKAFEEKALPATGEAANLHRSVIIASMVEAEAGLDSERATIAGVIENRLRTGQPLELDATVLYALGEWKELGPGVVRTVQSPYNTYLNRGLPPGPIGSPSAASLAAAAKPESHDLFYYVARPDRSHIFSRTYRDHINNIRKARAERAAQENR